MSQIAFTHNIGTNLPAPINVSSSTQSKVGYLAIGTSTAPSYPLDVVGTIQATGLKIPTGAGANKVLSSDTSGVASWQTAAGGTNYWTLSGTYLFPTSTSYNVGIGTSAPTGQLEINGTVIPIGNELVTNGTFTGGTSGWTLGSDAHYANNAVTVTYTSGDPYLSTTIATVLGKTYLITFTLSNVSGDQMAFGLDYNDFWKGPYIESVTVAFTSDYTGTDTIEFGSYDWNVGGTWTIDNISLKEGAASPALKVIGATGETGLYVNFSGNVGIGTTVPLDKLHVHFAANKNIRLRNPAVGTQIAAVNDADSAYTVLAIDGSSLLLNSQSTGNVGIGTTTPSAKLDVIGTIYGWNVPRTVKITTATHDGNFVGYAAMYNWIQANGCADYHVCDSVELTRLAQVGKQPTANCLYNGGVKAFLGTTQQIDDCRGWRDNTSTVSGAVWSTLIKPDDVGCNILRAVCCCL